MGSPSGPHLMLIFGEAGEPKLRKACLGNDFPISGPRIIPLDGLSIAPEGCPFTDISGQDGAPTGHRGRAFCFVGSGQAGRAILTR